MPQYRWEGSDPFRDHRNGRTIKSGEVVELAAAVADPHPDFASVDEPAGTCDEVKNDGDVCGRELPCPYHGEE